MRNRHAPEAVSNQERRRATRTHVFIQPRHPCRSRRVVPIVLLDADEVGMSGLQPRLPVMWPGVGPAWDDEDGGRSGQPGDSMRCERRDGF